MFIMSGMYFRASILDSDRKDSRRAFGYCYHSSHLGVELVKNYRFDGSLQVLL